MKTNKLGIPILHNEHNINGHSINKYTFNKYITLYFRVFRLRSPYFINTYGIYLHKQHKHENK